MPILNLKLSTQPSTERSARIATALTDLTVELLKKKRELTAVALDHVPPGEWFIAGASVAAQGLNTFHLDIKVTEGTNTKDEKARFIGQVFAVMEGIIGPLAPASYVVVHEVRGDAWGYQGQTQEFRYILGKSL